MKPQTRQRKLPPGEYRATCLDCFRPIDLCYCNQASPIENVTDVLILQHRKERDHPFNTARIVQRLLKKSRLICQRNEAFATTELPIQRGAGLLFPGPDAALLTELEPHQRPKQLVILDGTWHHAKTLFRDVPVLKTLPQYRLAPTRPGQYRIRLEPNAQSLSTVEAVAAALGQLEPETDSIDSLITTFNAMVEKQLAHPKANYTGLTIKPKRPPNLNIPNSIRGLDNLVVAYGEPAPIEFSKAEGWSSLNAKRASSRLPPVYWCAQRVDPNRPLGHPAKENLFSQTIRPKTPFADKFLKHMDLTAADFENALSVDQFRQRWNEFLKPNERLVVFNHRTIDQLKHCRSSVNQYEVIGSINYNPEKRFTSVEQFLLDQGHPKTPPLCRGRAGRRLAAAVSLVAALSSIKR